MLQRFLKLCRKPVIECSDATPVITSDNIVRKSYKKQTDGGINYHIDAFILPDDMKWPTFLPARQSASYSTNIYFQRQNKVDINRRKYSIDILRKKGNVFWSGAAGIGKSCDLNYIFIELLSHLGQDTWPREVAFRSGIELFTFTSTEVSRTKIRYSDLEEYSLDHCCDDSVLILELYDYENDPVIRMPFISAVPARDLDSKLKTLIKGRECIFMLMSPPDVEEVCLMTEAVMEFCPTNSIFRGSTKEEAVSIVRSRALKVGGILQFLFCDEDFYIARLLDMDSDSNALSRHLYWLWFKNIPRTVQCYVALFFREGVTEPNFYEKYKDAAPELYATISMENNLDGIEFMNSEHSIECRYVSDHAKLLHASTWQSLEDVEVLTRISLTNQVSETLILLGGIFTMNNDEKIDDCYTSENWEWHKDVGHKKFLSFKSLLSESKIPSLHRCSAEYVFWGQYYDGPVSQLDPDKLYRSALTSLAFFKYFTVDHTKKMIYLYRMAGGDLSDHPFDMSTIKILMTKLGMFDRDNLKYKVTLLCFCSWDLKFARGLKFFDVSKNVVDLKELKLTKDMVATRLQVYIIRACFFPPTTKLGWQ